MFSTQSDNCVPICPYFSLHFLFAVELEEPKIGTSGIGLNPPFAFKQSCVLILKKNSIKNVVGRRKKFWWTSLLLFSQSLLLFQTQTPTSSTLLFKSLQFGQVQNTVGLTLHPKQHLQPGSDDLTTEFSYDQSRS